jgi:hypothetical protein
LSALQSFAHKAANVRFPRFIAEMPIILLFSSDLSKDLGWIDQSHVVTSG